MHHLVSCSQHQCDPSLCLNLWLCSLCADSSWTPLPVHLGRTAHCRRLTTRLPRELICHSAAVAEFQLLGTTSPQVSVQLPSLECCWCQTDREGWVLPGCSNLPSSLLPLSAVCSGALLGLICSADGLLCHALLGVRCIKRVTGQNTLPLVTSRKQHTGYRMATTQPPHSCGSRPSWSCSSVRPKALSSSRDS